MLASNLHAYSGQETGDTAHCHASPFCQIPERPVDKAIRIGGQSLRLKNFPGRAAARPAPTRP